MGCLSEEVKFFLFCAMPLLPPEVQQRLSPDRLHLFNWAEWNQWNLKSRLPFTGRVNGEGLRYRRTSLCIRITPAFTCHSGRFWAEQAGILLVFFPSFLRQERNANAGISGNLSQDRKKIKEEGKAFSSSLDESRGIRAS